MALGCGLRSAVHLFIFGNVLSLCASSVVSWGGHTQNNLYYPVVLFVTALLVGFRGAVLWSVPLIFIVILTYNNNIGVFADTDLNLERLIHSVGAIVAALWISFETERYSNRQKNHLLSLTKKLQNQKGELNLLASFDSLTGLANRFRFQEKLNAQITQTVASRGQSALLVLDMDGFKEINDSLGHSIGDEVLKIVAKRITELVRDGDVVARLGGDEYTVLLHDVVDSEEVINLSKKIIQSIISPMSIEDHEVIVGVSIGGSLCPQDSTDSNELLAYADLAMYDAKTNKRGVAMYVAEMTEELVSRRLIQNRLRNALEREEFYLLYQPQASIETGEITGFECLIRWKDSTQSMSPLEFIEPLEASGRIIEVGRWVFEQACLQVREWQRLGLDLTIAINISPVQFRETNFVKRTIDLVNEHKINPALIKIEITEGLLIHDLDDAKIKLEKLKEFGFKISVDDFGTGYSSLAYLKNLPIDQLKIDRTFIKDIPNIDDGTIASSIILLGQKLGLDVIAEGVETAEQLHFIKTHNCNAYQGYLVGKPMSLEACEEFLGLNNYLNQIKRAS